MLPGTGTSSFQGQVPAPSMVRDVLTAMNSAGCETGMTENWVGGEDGQGDELPVGDVPAFTHTSGIYGMAPPPLSRKFWQRLSLAASESSPGVGFTAQLCNGEIRRRPQLTVMYLAAPRRRDASQLACPAGAQPWAPSLLYLKTLFSALSQRSRSGSLAPIRL